MSGLYFAYGSNLKLERLVDRVGEVRTTGIGWLADHRFSLDKLGADGSAKANLRPHPGGRVWGVVYEIPVAAWPVLDRHEGGYRRCVVPIVRDDATRIEATTYVSERLTPRPARVAYCALILEGAREHALPRDWIRQLDVASRGAID